MGSCEDCRFCVDAVDHDTVTGEPFEAFECIRFPPTVISCDSNVDGWISRSPFVNPEDCCGEWQPAKPGTPDEAALAMARAVVLGDYSAARPLADRLIELNMEKATRTRG